MSKQEFLKNNGVDVDTAVLNMIDFDTYYEILQEFYSTIDSVISKLNTYKDNNDMENYAIDVHALKSNARSLGFMDLGDIAYEHELKSKANDVKYVNDNFNILLDKINSVKQLITDCINL